MLRYNYRTHRAGATRLFPVWLHLVNVLYEDSGAFKVATVLADSDNALQVEAPHGKRAKIKSKDVLIRFPEPSAADLLAQAEALAGGIDADFLWQCCGTEEFGFADLAHEYCGRAPSAIEAAGILVKLHSAPMYFYRKGRGRYRAAPPETLRAALVGIERKKQQQMQVSAWAEQLELGAFPQEFLPLREQLLYKPDRNRAETKALEEACARTGLSPAKLMERCGALPSSHDYHLNRFFYEYFPQGTDFPLNLEIAEPRGLPVADADAFSLDDTATTEIDDAFSLTLLRMAAFAWAFTLPLPLSGSHPDRRSTPWRASGSRRCTCRAARSPCCRPKRSNGSPSPKGPSALHVPSISTYALTILRSSPATPAPSGCALRRTCAIRRSRTLMRPFLLERRGTTFLIHVN